MSMSVLDLIYELESIARDYGDDIEVRLAEQPNWPFEYSVSRVEVVQIADDDCSDPCPVCDPEWIQSDCGVCNGEGVVPSVDAPAFVYIAEGSQLGYLPGAVSSVLEWR